MKVKQIELRINIESRDLVLKYNKIISFINKGYEVNILVRLIGRNSTTIPKGLELMRNTLNFLSEHVSIVEKPEYDLGWKIKALVKPKNI